MNRSPSRPQAEETEAEKQRGTRLGDRIPHGENGNVVVAAIVVGPKTILERSVTTQSLAKVGCGASND